MICRLKGQRGSPLGRTGRTERAGPHRPTHVRLFNAQTLMNWRTGCYQRALYRGALTLRAPSDDMEQHVGDCDSESEHDKVARPPCSVQSRHVEEPWCGVVDSHAFRADTMLQPYGKVRSKVLQQPPQSVLAGLTLQQRAAFGHTHLHELTPELYKHASPWLARFVRLPSSRGPNTRIVCVSALESVYASNLHRRERETVATPWSYSDSSPSSVGRCC